MPDDRQRDEWMSLPAEWFHPAIPNNQWLSVRCGPMILTATTVSAVVCLPRWTVETKGEAANARPH